MLNLNGIPFMGQQLRISRPSKYPGPMTPSLSWPDVLARLMAQGDINQLGGGGVQAAPAAAQPATRVLRLNNMLSEDDLADEEHAKNNLPDVLTRWEERDDVERDRPRTAQSFCVPKAEIALEGAYDLSIARYKEAVHETVEHQSPVAVIAELRRLEAEISEGLSMLEEMVA